MHNSITIDSVDLDGFKKIEELVIDIRNYLSLIYVMLYEQVEAMYETTE